MILCFSPLNLNGMCQATSGPRLDMISFGMMLRLGTERELLWEGALGIEGQVVRAAICAL